MFKNYIHTCIHIMLNIPYISEWFYAWKLFNITNPNYNQIGIVDNKLPPRRVLGHVSWWLRVIRTNSSISIRLVGTQSVSINTKCLSGIVREQIYQCFKDKGSRPREMDFVKPSAGINWYMDGSGDFLVWSDVAAPCHQPWAEFFPELRAVGRVSGRLST